MDRFDLAELANRPLYALSTGQQVRVALAKAFLNRPRLVLLDEPTASLDPDVADRVRTLLMDVVREQKTTVFLTSHNMAEVEKVCSRVLFLKNGRIEAEGTPRDLARQTKRFTVVVTTNRTLHALPAIDLPPNADVRFEGKEIHAEMDRHRIGPFLTDLARSGVDLENVTIHEPSLEDFFVHSARREAP
jgi:ABC-2 type transport system ATP-binding protein